MILLETPDGGDASLFGAGPSGEWKPISAISISIFKLTEEVAEVIYSHAVQGDMVIALWPRSRNPNYVYAWDENGGRADYPEDVADPDVRAIPAADFVTNADQARDLPPDWPSPTVCATAEQLFEALRSAGGDVVGPPGS